MTRTQTTDDESTISARALRDALAQGEQLTVLDIRPRQDYESWHVPGSDNVPAYEALLEDDPGPLEDLDVDEEPVVTVCGRGATAAKATQILQDAGIEARTLDGGLRAWSTAWNTAQMQLDTGTTILQVRRVGKGCLSYIVASEGEAAVVDPALDHEIFQQLADERGWEITTVIETHLHADHVSRSAPLAETTGAEYHVPANEPADFDHEPVADGDEITVGSTTIEAIETPGHTPGSASYLLDDRVLFTGDTLFLNAVGRPDLEAEGREEQRARALYASLQQLLALDEQTKVLPAHADHALAFDGIPETDTLGQLAETIDVLGLDEEGFVDAILDRLPETPANHETIVDHNRQAAWPEEELTELEAGANRCAAG